MKAISLWQPWASLIANGAKRVETRSWETKYRGMIAIHAAKRKNKGENKDLAGYISYSAALGASSWHEANQIIDGLPYGYIVAIAILADCKPTEQFTEQELFTRRYADFGGAWCENDMGNFGRNRFGWILKDVQAIEPIPYKGEQGLFDIPEHVILQANAIRRVAANAKQS